VRIFPTCSRPVGEGAKRVTMEAMARLSRFLPLYSSGA
jgi:hypothetical protein